jgi:hypothetical protein
MRGPSRASLLKRINERGKALLLADENVVRRKGLSFVEVKNSELRRLFDQALDLTHYAKSCQRVGRCMRLLVVHHGDWVGGVVLGSTFPNVDVRDRALGLKIYVTGFLSRGLTNPWSGKNHEYWNCLQSIVNHARTFIFPQYQGQGFGKEAHRLLLKDGIKIWEAKYHQKVYALDTLCDHSDSGLFLSNGWVHVGQTKGFTADYKSSFTARRKVVPSINNAALTASPVRWQVWVRTLRPSLKPGLGTKSGQKTV